MNSQCNSGMLRLRQTPQLQSQYQGPNRCYCQQFKTIRATPKDQMKRKLESSFMGAWQSKVLVRDNKTTMLNEITKDRTLKRQVTTAGADNSSHGVSEFMMAKLDEIVRALKQPNMKIVGVYGSSNVRKRVVEKITNRVERDGVKVLHVMASTTKENTWFSWGKRAPKVRIQEELANQLVEKLHDKTNHVKRAKILGDKIKSMGNILIILDDLEDGSDWAEVVIPFGNDDLGSKILLLAHNKEVFSKSNQMNAPQKVIFVYDA